MVLAAAAPTGRWDRSPSPLICTYKNAIAPGGRLFTKTPVPPATYRNSHLRPGFKRSYSAFRARSSALACSTSLWNSLTDAASSVVHRRFGAFDSASSRERLAV